jgi:hypothetical protein
MLLSNFRKIFHIIFYDNIDIAGRVDSCEHRDRHGEVNSRTWTDIGNAAKTRIISLMLLSKVTLIFRYTQ